MMSVFERKLSECSKMSKGLVSMFVCQKSSLSSAEAKPEKLSKNLSYRPAFDSKIQVEERPLVLLYGWLLGKARHIHKYGDFYLNKGFDVLHIKIKPHELLWPVRSQMVAEQVVDFIQSHSQQQQPILAHGFSIGGYVYGETLVKVQSNPDLSDSIGTRICGQILDSPANVVAVPNGVSRALTDIPILQKMIRGSMNSYLMMFQGPVTNHYERSYAAFLANPCSVPTLFLYSKMDPVGAAGPIEEVGEMFRNRGVPAYLKCFEKSRHVSHFHTYPVEYIDQLNRFLVNVNLVDEEGVRREGMEA